VVAAECDFKRQAQLLADHFEKLLEVTCPNHTYPVKHKLKECTMMKKYMTTGNLARNKKPEGDSVGKVAAPFLEEKAVMSIYGGLTPHESHCKLKLIDRAINSMSATVLEYLHWSKTLITFDWTDHPDSIPKTGRFPLIVDPLVETTQLTKASWTGAAASTSCSSIPLRD
jgi:hypothetical protein